MTTNYKLRRLKTCADCGHHISAHKWDPERDSRTGPFDCTVCTCKKFRRLEPGERVKRRVNEK